MQDKLPNGIKQNNTHIFVCYSGQSAQTHSHTMRHLQHVPFIAVADVIKCSQVLGCATQETSTTFMQCTPEQGRGSRGAGGANAPPTFWPVAPRREHAPPTFPRVKS